MDSEQNVQILEKQVESPGSFAGFVGQKPLCSTALPLPENPLEKDEFCSFVSPRQSAQLELCIKLLCELVDTPSFSKAQSAKLVDNVVRRIYTITGTESKKNDEEKELLKDQKKMIDKLKADNAILLKKLSNCQEITEKQNGLIVEMLAEHKVELQLAREKEKEVAELANKFPIRSTEDLQKINGEINEGNKPQYISTMTLLLGGDPCKNMENILTRAICVDYNADGRCGKKGLKEFNFFFDALIGAVGHTSDNPDKEMRKALQVVKKRHFRLVSHNNNKRQGDNSTPT